MLLKRVDWLLAISVLLLSIIGLIVLHAINFKDTTLVQDFNPTTQIIAFVIGLVMFVVFARTDYRLWYRLSYLWYGAGLLLLGLVLIIGQETADAKLAINLGFVQFQPAEIIKIGLIMSLAHLLTRYSIQMQRFKFLTLSIVYLVVPMGLIMLQPDFGSGLVLVFIWFVMVLASTARKLHLGLLIAAGVLCLPLLINQLQPYQQERLQTFLNPTADPQGSGYNVVQSTIAVGSGRLLGKGLGAGSQGQLNFLPSQHTDFIFAILAEKLGFLGAVVALGLFAIILIRGVVIAWRAEDRFGMLLAAGIVAMLLFHIVINIGMNLGLMPVTGIPLPFLSYGGTNLIVSLIAAGLLQSIAIHGKKLEFQS